MPGDLVADAPTTWRRRIKRLAGWLAFVILSMLILFAPLPFPSTLPVERHLRIEASMFQYAPAEWMVNPGDRVTIELVSTDVSHGLSVDGYGFDLVAIPGQTARGSFIADKPGLFRFRCSVPCGNMHPFMIGKLQVGANLLWMRGIALGLLSVIAGLGAFSSLLSPRQVIHAA